MKTNFIVALSVCVSLFSCHKEDPKSVTNTDTKQDTVKTVPTTKSISGYAQKGPFIKSSRVQILELTEGLVQTGVSFSTEIKSDAGEFELKDIVLTNTKLELVADGYYFNEVNGALSDSRLVLTGLSDITDQNSINVNILTHITIDRIKTLMKNGASYKVAKETAQKEVYAIFGISLTNIKDFELLNITSSDEQNGGLLAISVLFQGKNSVAELSKLLADFKEDFSDNGLIDNNLILFKLKESAKNTNSTAVATNIKEQYKKLGQSITVPEFEKYVSAFSKTTLVDDTKYELSFPTQGDFGVNILSFPAGTTSVTAGEIYSLNATFPDNADYSLSLKANGGDANVSWTVDKTKMTGWSAPLENYKQLNLALQNQSADQPIVFSGTGKFYLELSVKKLNNQIEFRSIVIEVK